MHTLSTRATLHSPPLNACLFPFYVTEEKRIIGPLVAQAPSWLHFTPGLRKEKGAWEGMKGSECQLLPAAPVIPCEVLWPHSLSWHHKSQAQSIPQIPEWKAQGDPILVLSEKWMNLASCKALVCLTNFSLHLSKLQKFRPDFEWGRSCGIVGASGRTKKKRSLLRSNGQHLRKIQLASRPRSPNSLLLQ